MERHFVLWRNKFFINCLLSHLVAIDEGGHLLLNRDKGLIFFNQLFLESLDCRLQRSHLSGQVHLLLLLLQWLCFHGLHLRDVLRDLLVFDHDCLFVVIDQCFELLEFGLQLLILCLGGRFKLFVVSCLLFELLLEDLDYLGLCTSFLVEVIEGGLLIYALDYFWLFHGFNWDFILLLFVFDFFNRLVHFNCLVHFICLAHFDWLVLYNRMGLYNWLVLYNRLGLLDRLLLFNIIYWLRLFFSFWLFSRRLDWNLNRFNLNLWWFSRDIFFDLKVNFLLWLKRRFKGHLIFLVCSLVNLFSLLLGHLRITFFLTGRQ